MLIMLSKDSGEKIDPGPERKIEIYTLFQRQGGKEAYHVEQHIPV